MPAPVPRTSTSALANATLLYSLELAAKAVERAARDNAELARRVNPWRGAFVRPAVAAALDREPAPARPWSPGNARSS